MRSPFISAFNRDSETWTRLELKTGWDSAVNCTVLLSICLEIRLIATLPEVHHSTVPVVRRDVKVVKALVLMHGVHTGPVHFLSGGRLCPLVSTNKQCSSLITFITLKSLQFIYSLCFCSLYFTVLGPDSVLSSCLSTHHKTLFWSHHWPYHNSLQRTSSITGCHYKDKPYFILCSVILNKTQIPIVTIYHYSSSVQWKKSSLTLELTKLPLLLFFSLALVVSSQWRQFLVHQSKWCNSCRHSTL